MLTGGCLRMFTSQMKVHRNHLTVTVTLIVLEIINVLWVL